MHRPIFDRATVLLATRGSSVNIKRSGQSQIHPCVCVNFKFERCKTTVSPEIQAGEATQITSPSWSAYDTASLQFHVVYRRTYYQTNLSFGSDTFSYYKVDDCSTYYGTTTKKYLSYNNRLFKWYLISGQCECLHQPFLTVVNKGKPFCACV